MISDTAKSPAVQREGLRLRCRGADRGPAMCLQEWADAKDLPRSEIASEPAFRPFFVTTGRTGSAHPQHRISSVATRGFIGDLATQRQGTFGRCVGAFFGENPGSAESIFGLGFGATGSGRTGQSSTLPETKRTFPLPFGTTIITGRKRPTIGCSLEQSGKSMGHRNIRAS